MRRKNSVTTLYRIIDHEELQALRQLRYRRFPPCLEAAFYPALSEHFALQLLQQWKELQRPAGYLTRFKIGAVYVRSFEVQTLSGEVHEELWVPAEELDAFNQNIVGRIEVVGV